MNWAHLVPALELLPGQLTPTQTLLVSAGQAPRGSVLSRALGSDKGQKGGSVATGKVGYIPEWRAGTGRGQSIFDTLQTD